MSAYVLADGHGAKCAHLSGIREHRPAAIQATAAKEMARQQMLLASNIHSRSTHPSLANVLEAEGQMSAQSSNAAPSAHRSLTAISFIVAVTNARSSLSSLQISWAQAKHMPDNPKPEPMRIKQAHFQPTGMSQTASEV